MKTGGDALLKTTSQPMRRAEEEDSTVAQVTTRPELGTGHEVQGALVECVTPGSSVDHYNPSSLIPLAWRIQALVSQNAVDQPSELQLLRDKKVVLHCWTLMVSQ